jgi:membrane protease YdiL (CAAX protease family)
METPVEPESSTESDSLAAPASLAAPESRRFRLFELALVMGVAFLPSIVFSLYDWWNGSGGPFADDDYSSLLRLLRAVLSIALLGYVLYWQGRSWRSIGLTAQRSDIPWTLALVMVTWVFRHAVAGALSSFHVPDSKVTMSSSGLLPWLAVVPGAASEELIVRAFLMTEVAELTGSMGIAVLASTGFQTLYHLYWGTRSALVAAAAFFVFSLFYASTRRITPVILAHSLHNYWVLVSQIH